MSDNESDEAPDEPVGTGWQPETPLRFKGVGKPLVKGTNPVPLRPGFQEQLSTSIIGINSELMPKVNFTGVDTSGWKSVSEVLARILDAWKAVDMSRSRKIMADSLGPIRTLSEQVNQAANIFTPVLARMTEEHRALLADLRRALEPWRESLSKSLMQGRLPPNLWDIWDQVTLREIYDFTVREAIPLYLVPSADNALRFIKAPDQARRRQVLNDRKDALIKDCEAALEGLQQPEVGEGVELVQDGIAALRAGHHRAAQALFTTVFDTTISSFYPERGDRRPFTNKNPNHISRPLEIEQLPLMEKFVWLSVWNAHAAFHSHEAKAIPNEYSRHATVHAASRKQYTQRNAVQVMLLVTSLIGFKNAQIGQGQFKPRASKSGKKQSI